MSTGIYISTPPKHKHDCDNTNTEWQEKSIGSHRDLALLIRDYPNKIIWATNFSEEELCYRKPFNLKIFKNYLLNKLPDEIKKIELMCRILSEDKQCYIGISY
jgi:hypothetical protein